MRKMKIPANFVPLFFSMFLLAGLVAMQALHAQTAPAAGTSVAVRMVDAVNSANDPAGKQYRASVTNAVNAGNGVTIPQGAAATVTLSSSGSGFTAQLASVTISGQPVAVASSSASVTSAAQTLAGNAANRLNSVLGGLGHHVDAPAPVTVVATGQRVILPPGTTLTFVLSQPPAASAAPASTAVPAKQTASAAPAQSSAATHAQGTDAYYCRYYGQKDGHPITYLTPVIYESTQGFGNLSGRFMAFLKSTYDIDKIQQGAGACRRLSNDPATQANSMDMMEKQGAAGNGKLTRLTWTDSPAEAAKANASIASAAAAAQYAAAHPAAPFISCSTRGTPGVDIYVTGIFQTTKPIKQSPNGAKFVDQSVIDNFNAYLTQKGYKFTPGNNGSCDVSPTLDAAQTAQHTRIHGGPGSCGYCGFKTIETGWKDE